MRLVVLGSAILLLVLNACAPAAETEDVESGGAALSGYRGAAPNATDIERPAYAPEGFYPESNVGEYYGPCGPLSATWLMTWYVGRGPGGSVTNQEAFNRVSSYAQGDRVLPGSSPSGLSYAINRMLEGGFLAGRARSRTGASIEDIRGHVAARHPVVTLIQWQDGNNNFPSMHYVTIFGYRRAGDSFVYLLHDNGSFKEMKEADLDPARDTSFYNRGIVWIDAAVYVDLPHE